MDSWTKRSEATLASDKDMVGGGGGGGGFAIKSQTEDTTFQ